MHHTYPTECCGDKLADCAIGRLHDKAYTLAHHFVAPNGADTGGTPQRSGKAAVWVGGREGGGGFVHVVARQERLLRAILVGLSCDQVIR